MILELRYLRYPEMMRSKLHHFHRKIPGDEMWSLYAEKLRLLAERLEEALVGLERGSLGPSFNGV